MIDFLNIPVDIKILNDKAKIPTRGSSAAAGWDLYAMIDKDIHLEPGESVKIDTGIAIEIPEGFFGAIYPRSGLAIKQGLRLCNCTAVIDSDYRGSIIVALYNDSKEVRIIEPQERIAQLVIQPYLPIQWHVTEELSETERGNGGLGSTGTR